MFMYMKKEKKTFYGRKYADQVGILYFIFEILQVLYIIILYK